MITFKDFVHNYKLKIEPKSIIKLHRTSHQFVAERVCNFPFSTTTGIVTLHQTKGLHWIA